MNKLIILPEDFAVKLEDCRPGLFLFKAQLYVKTNTGQVFNCAFGNPFAEEFDPNFETKDLEVIPVFSDWRDTK